MRPNLNLTNWEENQMARVSRRRAGPLRVAGSASMPLARNPLRAAARINSVVRAVQIGSRSYSFGKLPLEGAIEAFRTVGLGECELSQLHVEARDLQGEKFDNPSGELGLTLISKGGSKPCVS